MGRIPGKQIILDIDPTLSNDSDILISSQKAIKAYVDNSISSSGFAITIVGDDTTIEFNITHNLNTLDVFIQVYELIGNENINVTASRIDINNVKITFALSPPLGESYRVMIS